MLKGTTGTSMHIERVKRPKALVKLGQVVYGSKTLACFRCGKRGRMMRDYDDVYRLVIGFGPGAMVPKYWTRHPRDCG
jgi:hypothetical protein